MSNWITYRPTWGKSLSQNPSRLVTTFATFGDCKTFPLGGSGSKNCEEIKQGTVLLPTAHFTRTMRGLHKKCFPPYSIPPLECTGVAARLPPDRGHWHCFHSSQPAIWACTAFAQLDRVSFRDQNLQPINNQSICYIWILHMATEPNLTLGAMYVEKSSSTKSWEGLSENLMALMTATHIWRATENPFVAHFSPIGDTWL